MTRIRFVVGGSVWLVLCVSLWLTDSRPAVVALVGVVGVGVASVVAIIDIATNIGDTGWPRAVSRRAPTQADQWATQLRHQMIGARRTGSRDLHDRLAALAPAHPALLADSPRRLGSPRTVERIVADIEAL